MGFSPPSTIVWKSPTREEILSSLEPDLRQRFRDEIPFFAPMRRDDYHQFAKEGAKQNPPGTRAAWQHLIGPAVDEAVEGMLGMRVFKELLLKAMMLGQVNPIECQKIELTIE